MNANYGRLDCRKTNKECYVQSEGSKFELDPATFTTFKQTNTPLLQLSVLKR